MNDIRTYCFGRFLIDLPPEAELQGQRYDFMFGQITSSRTSEAEFAKTLEETEEALRAAARSAEQRDYKLNAVRLKDRNDARLFTTTRTIYGDTATGFELYRWSSGVSFSMQDTAYEPASFGSVLNMLETRLIPHLRARGPDEIPDEPGFCIDNGFIADDGAVLQTEYAAMSFRFPRWPDVRLSVNTRRNGDKLEPSLLERRANNPIPAIYAEVAKRMKKFREGKRSAGPIAGEEVLRAYPTDDGFFTHGFVWDARGEARSAQAPAIYLEFDTGENPLGGRSRFIPPSLTDEQAIGLFDRIVNSIRLRPTRPAPRSEASDPPSAPRPPFAIHLPLGAQAASETVCRQAGVWRCAHANTVGGPERFIGEGQMLPTVLVPQPLSLLQKLRREPRSRLTPTTWTLVAYPEEGRG